MKSSPRLLLVRASFLCLGLVVGTRLTALAQGPGNGGPQPGAATVPIDGGASLLLAGGLAFGLRRLQQRQEPE